MWKLLKRNGAPSSDRVAGHIAAFILKAQFRLANWLASKEKQWTIRQKKCGLAILCMLVLFWTGHLLSGILSYQDPHRIKAEWLKQPSDTVKQKGSITAGSSLPGSKENLSI